MLLMPEMIQAHVKYSIRQIRQILEKRINHKTQTTNLTFTIT